VGVGCKVAALSRSATFLAILPLAGGAGLVAYIVAGLSLRVGIALAVAMGLIAAWAVWRRTPADVRPALKRRAMVGLVAGAAATAAYDVSRLVFVKALGLGFWPFDVFPLFGRLLVGAEAPRVVAEAAGVLYHFSNGIGFAVAYVFLFRKTGLLTGLLWAAVLELCMISLYPTWLNPSALDELLSVSVIGHGVYGAVLGVLARRGVPQ
jgi:hypothetical protein